MNPAFSITKITRGIILERAATSKERPTTSVKYLNTGKSDGGDKQIARSSRAMT